MKSVKSVVQFFLVSVLFGCGFAALRSFLAIIFYFFNLHLVSLAFTSLHQPSFERGGELRILNFEW